MTQNSDTSTPPASPQPANNAVVKDKRLRWPIPNWGPAVLVLLVFLALASRMFRLTYRYAVNIFFSDQWDFNNASLFQKHSLWEMFAWQHGPPRLGLGPVLQWAIEPLFHWNSRTESFVVAGILVIGAACAIYLKKKLYGEISFYDVIIPLVFFAYVPYASLFITADIAHGPLPLVLLILYGLSWTCASRPIRYALVLVINFVTIYTGFGLFLGLLTPPLFVADYWVNLRKTSSGLLYVSVALVSSVASFASFFIGYKIQPAADCFSFHLQSPIRYFWFVDLMYASVFGAKGNSVIANVVGTVVVLIMIAALVLACRDLLRNAATHWGRNVNIVTLIAFSLLFSFNTAYGRLCTGWQTAQSPRYANYLQLGLLGVYFSFLTLRKRLVRNIAMMAMLLAFFQSVPIRSVDRNTMRSFSQIKRSWKACYLSTEDIKHCDQVAGFWIYPWPEATHLKEKLDFLKRNKLNLYADSK